MWSQWSSKGSSYRLRIVLLCSRLSSTQSHSELSCKAAVQFTVFISSLTPSLFCHWERIRLCGSWYSAVQWNSKLSAVKSENLTIAHTINSTGVRKELCYFMTTFFFVCPALSLSLSVAHFVFHTPNPRYLFFCLLLCWLCSLPLCPLEHCLTFQYFPLVNCSNFCH